MRRALLAGALLALVAACGSDNAPPVTIGFRQPSALAEFRGVTRDDPASVRPYLAVANAARNDLTILDATDDTVVQAPVQLRALVLPVAERPALLAAASLGDDDSADPLDGADLLVAVSAGDSVLQVVNTWEAAPATAVFTEPGEGSPAVDLGGDIVALAALPPDPSAPGVARVAAALADERIAVVRWSRAADSPAIELDQAPLVVSIADINGGIPFQPVALAAMPDDPAPGLQTAIYAATLDPLAPGVFGVAEISLDLTTVRPLDARGPTRLVAAARLRERSPSATSKEEAAFDGQPLVARVYAVLDESGCGPDRAIACGVATIDPEKGAIADDWVPAGLGRMPYRGPIPIPGRPLAIAVSPPPAAPPSPADAGFAGDAMRFFAGSIPEVTTALGLVASDDGKVYFLDLGRFRAVTTGSTLRQLNATVSAREVATTSGGVTLQRRLWIQNEAGEFVADADAAKLVGRTPGWTRTVQWSVTWQGELPQLTGRAAEAGPIAADRVWLALQSGSGTPRRFSQVVKLWHPALGVRAGDVAVLKSAGVPGCVPDGTPADAAAALEFEAPIAALRPPGPDHPGGAVELARPAETADPDWVRCFDALAGAAATDGVVPRLSATIRAGGFLVTSGGAYAGRPEADPAPERPNSWTYALVYPAAGDEDSLADACPLVDWDGLSAPPIATCDAACRDACEAALLARRARRVHHNFEDCSTDPDQDAIAACLAAFGGSPDAEPSTVPAGAPALHGPVVSFRFGVEPLQGAATEPVRGLSLQVFTNGGESPASPTVTGSPYRASSAIAFDRSTVNPAAGYRFLVSYTSDMVLDVSPHVTPTDVKQLR